jgi:hypothetical protein
MYRESLILSLDYDERILSLENLQDLAIIAALAHPPTKAARRMPRAN